MSYILGLPLMDLNCGAESMTLSLGFAFSGAIDQCHVQEACVKIARAWPILGSRLQRNSQTGKIEAVLPDPKEARLKVTFREFDSKFADLKTLHIRTKSISTQVLKRSETLYREHALKNIEHYLVTGEPAFGLHIDYLLDATVITLTSLHILMDGSSFAELAKAFILTLGGEPIPPALAHDPWSILLPRALEQSNNPDVDAILGWKIWDAKQDITSGNPESKAPEADGPIEQRIIYFPASEIARLKNEALAELELAGTPVPFLSTSDVVSAWLYKHTFIDSDHPEEQTCFVCAVDARNRFPEAFTPGHAYIQNAFFTMCTRRLASSEVRSKSLGELAYLIHTSVQKQTAPNQLLAQLKWKHDHAGQTQIQFNPEAAIQLTSSWLSFALGDLSIESHVKPGTGTGQILDVIYDAIGVGQDASVIKFKDMDGGIVCDAFWGAQRWKSRGIAKYAL